MTKVRAALIFVMALVGWVLVTLALVGLSWRGWAGSIGLLCLVEAGALFWLYSDRPVRGHYPEE